MAKKIISKMVFTTEIAGLLKKAVTGDELTDPSPPLSPRARHTVENILQIMLPGEGEEKTMIELESEIPIPLDGTPITKGEIELALEYLADLPERGIMEEMTGAAVGADQIWSMRRQPYSGYGHYSMRPMPTTGTSNGGYEPITPWAEQPNGEKFFMGFDFPLSPYFTEQYFFTPDNQ